MSPQSPPLLQIHKTGRDPEAPEAQRQSLFSPSVPPSVPLALISSTGFPAPEGGRQPRARTRANAAGLSGRPKATRLPRPEPPGLCVSPRRESEGDSFQLKGRSSLGLKESSECGKGRGEQARAREEGSGCSNQTQPASQASTGPPVRRPGPLLDPDGAFPTSSALSPSPALALHTHNDSQRQAFTLQIFTERQARVQQHSRCQGFRSNPSARVQHPARSSTVMGRPRQDQNPGVQLLGTQ